MAKALKMPKLAMGMNEGTINEWLVAQGDWVEKGQPLMTVETEKVAYDCEAPQSGYINILTPEGETVAVDHVIGEFSDSGVQAASLPTDNAAGPATSPSPAAPATPAAQRETPSSPVSDAGQGQRRTIASPLARKIAREQSVDLHTLQGSGPKGRILKQDVERAISERARVAQPAASDAARDMSSAMNGVREKARIPLQGMRGAIAERMMQSLQTTAQLSSTWESDISNLQALRQKLLARADQLGTRVSMNALIIKAIVCAVRSVPIANACRQGDDIVIYDNINMGIAIAVPGTSQYDSGLLVGVLRNVEAKTVVEIDKAMKSLIERVRSKQTADGDLGGSTITLSSTAGMAPPGLQSTPVLNPPNAVLVGPSTPQDKAVVRDGQVEVRTMMPLSLTFDHCVLDGEPAARFAKAIHDNLENPELML